ncbi:DUF2249 domain-containing protein [Rhodoblastus sp.]|jgi:uncharacterized protein (DUF2249 family)|uniref:DUF2249 domain-containing protein n=1 Tax=Rhodoblastus sp. TaxID=1962975 RepID=UPI0025E534F7|nr:DUF2249 domain-containing protein [Rhodoblastus sp.]
MALDPYELDLRPILRAGGEPFADIMQAADGLAPSRSLRLLATFEPVPLYRTLARKGFDHAAREIGDGDWEVLFTRADSASGAGPGEQPRPSAGLTAQAWPEPLFHEDLRDLDPPEPMVRVLASLEEMRPGEVLSALLCREPLFLFPELRQRGHDWRGAAEPDGRSYRLLVRARVDSEAAA